MIILLILVTFFVRVSYKFSLFRPVNAFCCILFFAKRKRSDLLNRVYLFPEENFV